MAGKRRERAVRWDALRWSPSPWLEAVTGNSFGITSAANTAEDQRLSANGCIKAKAGAEVKRSNSPFLPGHYVEATCCKSEERSSAGVHGGISRNFCFTGK